MGCTVTMKIGLVIFFYLPYRGAPDDSEVHWCVMFNDTGVLYSVLVIFIIKYDGAFEH
jgi:hypothetical protein